ncbi:MAG: transglutaminase-like domain-containing protein [Planctomycetota bacterium]
MSERVYCRPAAIELFAEQLRSLDSTNGLFRAAFAIALHERPEASLVEVETVLENLADTVTRRVQSRSPDALLAHLHDVLFDVFGLRGNVEDYYNPTNSYLPEVLRTKQGLPIVLVLVYKCVAERLGLVVHGVNAPGHFLAEVEVGTDASYIDPFFGGSLLSRDDIAHRIQQATGMDVRPNQSLLGRATHRQWLARMLNNLQAAFARLGQDRDVLAMQELQELL